ncbi:MAG: type II toxin-antitoxin system RelE/ParE family toxin [Terriglobia bacterium]|jgi:toxin ParE1/3/4
MPLAEQDLEAAYEYVRQDNEDAARQLVARIFSSVGMLMRHPMAGREGRVKGTRELVVARTPYIVAYRVQQNEIQILAVLHGAQRWPSTFSTN